MKKNNQGKKEYIPAKLIFEGGGIRHGLTPSEAALLLDKPFSFVVAVILVELLSKGFIQCGGDNPSIFEVADVMKTRRKAIGIEERAEIRRRGAQELSQVLYPYEEPVLELLEQSDGKNVTEIGFNIIQKPLKKMLSDRVQGYDLEQTQAYYRAIVKRSINELTPKNNNIKERDIHWSLLDTAWEDKLAGYSTAWFLEIEATEKSDFINFTKELAEQIGS